MVGVETSSNSARPRVKHKPVGTSSAKYRYFKSGMKPQGWKCTAMDVNEILAQLEMEWNLLFKNRGKIRTTIDENWFHGFCSTN